MFIQTINKAKGKFLVKGRAKTKPMILQPIICYSSVFFFFLIGTSYLLRSKKKKKSLRSSYFLVFLIISFFSLIKLLIIGHAKEDIIPFKLKKKHLRLPIFRWPNW